MKQRSFSSLLFAATLAIACALPVHADPGDSDAQERSERAMERAVQAQASAEARAAAVQARAEAAQARQMAEAQARAEAQEQSAQALEEREFSALSALNTLPLTAISPEMFGHKRHHEAVDSGDNGGGNERPVNERRPLNADGRVFVNDVAGTVVVTAWERNEVLATGTLGYGVDRLEISGDPSDLSFVVKLPRHNHNVGETELRLMVPAGAHVEVETVSADVSAQGVRGPLKISTVSGDVGADVQSQEVAVQTVSGDLILRAPSKSTQANTVS
ncbi:MAG TPA: hypothetical protein VNX47_10855, partial [Nevskia sp.]|nr:hypothetical protein [Nevskia sp.]